MDRYESKVNGHPFVYMNDGVQFGNNKLLFSDMSNISFRDGETPAWTFVYKGRNFLVPYAVTEKELVEPFIRKAMQPVEVDFSEVDWSDLVQEAPAAAPVAAPVAAPAVEPAVRAQPSVAPPSVAPPTVEPQAPPKPAGASQIVIPEVRTNPAAGVGAQGPVAQPSQGTVPNQSAAINNTTTAAIKTVTCKQCGAQIAKNAKKCPHCGGINKKPIYKRVWFIILCAVVLIGIIGAIAGGGDEDSTDVSKNNDTEIETTVEATEEATEAPTETEAPDPTADYNMEEKNCYQAALNYLDLMGFSKKGLIEQLSSEYGDNYPQATAEKIVNDLEKTGQVDWEKQAERSAQSYLDTMSFSKDELVEQLCSEYGDQYTREEAEKAVDAVYK